MLVIISDLHLGDGTIAESIPASAFYLFAKRLRQDAHFASMHFGKYKPIEELDVILLGDILDPIHSTKWLYPLKGHEEYVNIDGQDHIRITEPGDPEYIRPWSDSSDPKFAAKLMEITRAIIDKNAEAFSVMRKLASGEFIEFDPTDESGERAAHGQDRIPLKVNFHYMVGNHDWYYHLKGEAFDQVRSEIITAMALRNKPEPFPYDMRKMDPGSPWQADENDDINRLYRDYMVFGRHGDMFDGFNFDPEVGRDQATLGDVFAMEVCNRYPEELKRKPNLDLEVVNNLRNIANIRPALATALWISGQIKSLSSNNLLSGTSERDLKRIWDDLADQFLELDFVKSRDKAFKFDTVDKMQAAIKVSKVISLQALDKIIYKIQHRRLSGGGGHSFAGHALDEPAFKKDIARYIVYGHTHFQETIPLDYDLKAGNQMYFNSGTWHTYFDLARKNPREKKFIPYKALSYITFYKETEHDDRHFETWTGAYA